jgi:hypothetical protein
LLPKGQRAPLERDRLGDAGDADKRVMSAN